MATRAISRSLRLAVSVSAMGALPVYAPPCDGADAKKRRIRLKKETSSSESLVGSSGVSGSSSPLSSGSSGGVRSNAGARRAIGSPSLGAGMEYLSCRKDCGMGRMSDSCTTSATDSGSAASGKMNRPPLTGKPLASNMGITCSLSTRCTNRRSERFLPSSTSLCTSPRDRAPLSPCMVVIVCPRIVTKISSLQALRNPS